MNPSRRGGRQRAGVPLEAVSPVQSQALTRAALLSPSVHGNRIRGLLFHWLDDSPSLTCRNVQPQESEMRRQLAVFVRRNCGGEDTRKQHSATAAKTSGSRKSTIHRRPCLRSRRG